jgi:immunity protein 35 of polymorphic toxin system
MITQEDAATIARRFLKEHVQHRVPEEVVLAGFEEHPTCWVFGYNTRAYVETRALSRALAGNGPIIVNRRTGSVRQGTTARPVEEQLDND